jgi:hypothetical protein
VGSSITAACTRIVDTVSVFSAPLIISGKPVLSQSSGSVEQCQSVAERFKQNGTWWVPTLFIHSSGGDQAKAIAYRFPEAVRGFWSDPVRSRNWLRGIAQGGDAGDVRPPGSPADSLDGLRIAQRVGLPMLAGTDTHDAPGKNRYEEQDWGLSLHAELAMFIASGLTPLSALQSATINPAKMLHGTDSLGTVTPGKLADLVLLDANPLVDIINTTTIRAVVANGRYFDRAALDKLVIDVRASGEP